MEICIEHHVEVDIYLSTSPCCVPQGHVSFYISTVYCHYLVNKWHPVRSLERSIPLSISLFLIHLSPQNTNYGREKQLKRIVMRLLGFSSQSLVLGITSVLVMQSIALNWGWSSCERCWPMMALGKEKQLSLISLSLELPSQKLSLQRW